MCQPLRRPPPLLLLALPEYPLVQARVRDWWLCLGCVELWGLGWEVCWDGKVLGVFPVLSAYSGTYVDDGDVCGVW